MQQLYVGGTSRCDIARASQRLRLHELRDFGSKYVSIEYQGVGLFFEATHAEDEAVGRGGALPPVHGIAS